VSDETPGFFSNHGSLDGPIAPRDMEGDLPVFASPSVQGSPIGIAHPVGWISDRNTLLQLFRLRINAVALSELWVCDRRIFVRLSERVESPPDEPGPGHDS